MPKASTPFFLIIPRFLFALYTISFFSFSSFFLFLPYYIAALFFSSFSRELHECSWISFFLHYALLCDRWLLDQKEATEGHLAKRRIKGQGYAFDFLLLFGQAKSSGTSCHDNGSSRETT